MPGACQITPALRGLVASFLAILVVMGPPGLAVSWAENARADACDDACPCEAEKSEVEKSEVEISDERTETSVQAVELAARPDAQNSSAIASTHSPEDVCPDSCPDCDCGVRIAVMLALRPALIGLEKRRFEAWFADSGSPVSRDAHGVFVHHVLAARRNNRHLFHSVLRPSTMEMSHAPGMGE